MSIVVVGAGVTGLTVADRLLACDPDLVVLEREPTVGGLCRSYQYGDFTFDVGPHRLFSSNPVVHDYFLSILDGRYSVIPRDSQVYLNGKYLNWPLSAMAVFRLPPGQAVRVLVDLVSRKPREANDIKSLEDYVLAHYGSTIFETFWEGYTEKFLGVRCADVDAVWGHISVGRSIVDRSREPDSLFALARSALLPRKPKLDFLYPHGGMGTFPQLMADRIEGRGGRVALSQEIREIYTDGDRIASVVSGGTSYGVDRLVWTGSLPELCRLLGEPGPDVRYLSTILYNIEVDGTLPGSWQWIYFPDSRCTFSRVSCPSRFGLDCAPADTSGLCVEVSCDQGGDAWNAASDMRDAVLDDAVRVGLLASRDRALNCHVERVPNTYPIYRVGFQKTVDDTLARLSRYKNLHVVGRQAAFVHDNIDEAIECAFELADTITGRPAHAALPVS
jgi:protoporphyrinogen oxidase